MKDFFNNTVNSELFFVYALIFIVAILIVIILIIDKKESKNKPKSLFDTLNMKAFTTVDLENIEDATQDLKAVESPIEVIQFQKTEVEDNFSDIKSIDEVAIKKEEPIKDFSSEYDYVETDLEKTQAQIDLEEITNALRNAKKEEPADQYMKFEEEQEKNAIISYHELKEVYNQLYDENEKVQYTEDDDIPINIDDLFQKKKEFMQIDLEEEVDTTLLQTKSTEDKSFENEEKKVVLQDFSSMKDSSSKPPVSTFKSSPLISPVYGIQKEPVRVNTNNENLIDEDIQVANQFLNNLKELKNNLDS